MTLSMSLIHSSPAPHWPRFKTLGPTVRYERCGGRWTRQRWLTLATCQWEHLQRIPRAVQAVAAQVSADRTIRVVFNRQAKFAMIDPDYLGVF